MRVLTIDDAHPDDSVEVAKKIAARDCVDVTVHAVNKGTLRPSTSACWSGLKVILLCRRDHRRAAGSRRTRCIGSHAPYHRDLFASRIHIGGACLPRPAPASMRAMLKR